MSDNIYRPNCTYLNELQKNQSCSTGPAIPDQNKIALGDYSTKGRLTFEDLTFLAEALNNILESFCNDWGFQQYRVIPIKKGTELDVPFQIGILDYSDVAGAGAYHYSQVIDNKLYYISRAFIESMVDANNGDVEAAKYMGKGANAMCLTSTLSHELFEMLADRIANSASSTLGRPLTLYELITPDGKPVNKDALFANITSPPIFYVMNETVDPVQANKNMIYISGKQVQMSDYVLPAWFSPNNSAGPFNYMRTLTEPFSVDPGGYMPFFYKDVEYYSIRPSN